ncbi:MAG: TerB family tellurite resistance protein [Leptospiraceae bacterium]|nr:TerB family tellurite resistance protein [Leptospiraceae bacterium]MCP5493038.1 TerB family tellurite resistance protein [Leptospiraceae bacterium]
MLSNIKFKNVVFDFQQKRLPVYKDKIFLEKLIVARYMVSLWSHSAKADEGDLKKIEKSMLNDMLNYLFEEDNLFHKYKKYKKNIRTFLKPIFYSPIPLPKIYKFIQKRKDLANLFYEDACSFVAADARVSKSEKKFLDKLSKELNLYTMDKKILDHKYSINHSQWLKAI